MTYDESQDEGDDDFDLGDVFGETPISEMSEDDIESDDADPGYELDDSDCGSVDEDPWDDDDAFLDEEDNDELEDE